MSSEPSYPKDAPVGDPEKRNETLDVAVTAKQARERADDAPGARKTRSFVKGAAVGVGSAAVVAALLYANRSRRGGDKRDSSTSLPPPAPAPGPLGGEAE